MYFKLSEPMTLQVSPIKLCSLVRRKYYPRYISPFEAIDNVGLVAYKVVFSL